MAGLIEKWGTYLLDFFKQRSEEKFYANFFSVLVSRLEEAVFSLMLLVDEEEQSMFQDTSEDFIRAFITPVIIAMESVTSGETNIVLLCTEKQVSKSQDLTDKESASTFFVAPILLSHVSSMDTVVLTRGSFGKSRAVHNGDNKEEEGWSNAGHEPDLTTMMADRTEKHAKTWLIDLTVAVLTSGLADCVNVVLIEKNHNYAALITIAFTSKSRRAQC